ncbi:MAG: formyltransferase family protein [Chitinophagales bacterium]
MHSDSDSEKKHLIIFASGAGTNAENCIRYFAAHPQVEVVLLVTNKRTSGIPQLSEKYHIPMLYLSNADMRGTHMVVAALAAYTPDLILLAGYLSLIPAELIRNFRFINVHPALLPKFGGPGMYGKKVHEAVVAAGEQISGITIHAVDEQYDNGAILFQQKVDLEETDDATIVEQKVRELEYIYLPRIVEKLLVTGELS